MLVMPAPSVHTAAARCSALASPASIAICLKPGGAREIFSRYEGDVRTHIFKISLGASDRMFSADGKLRPASSGGLACLGCHGSRDINWARTMAKGIHTFGKR